MNKRIMDTNVELTSEEWIGKDEDGTEIAFIQAGFSSTDEILNLRIYDMLNIYGIDYGRAMDIMTSLYRFFNEDRESDDDLYDGIIDQYFDFHRWNKEHPDPSGIYVKDIILEDGMNMDALIWIFDRIVDRFWRSDEYSRSYRYSSYQDLMSKKEKEKQG